MYFKKSVDESGINLFAYDVKKMRVHSGLETQILGIHMKLRSLL